MNSAIPKQFMKLAGKPVILHTIDAFFNYNPEIEVILVLPTDQFSTWHSIVDGYRYTKPVTLQEGGETRFQSVKNGLAKISTEGLVAIHDGVRPLITNAMIATSFRLADRYKAAIAAVPLKESIRSIDNGSSASLDRSKFKLIQTPQTFDVALIKNAYEMREDDSLTDDASVAERAGHQVHLFDGDYRNIKITTPEDLVVAEALYKGGTE